MLSYQHGYHAGNPADVHKHSLLAWVLSYMTQKDKPLSYLETHAGRGLYDLRDPVAQKTGEALMGIGHLRSRIRPDHPYIAALDKIAAAHGPDAYPGSPLLAATCLRDGDSLHLAELHPQEHAALEKTMAGRATQIRKADGWQFAQSLCPPTPRRGLLLIDPSYEIKSDYAEIPRWIAQIHRKWAVGLIMLWYPILKDGPHKVMVRALQSALPDSIAHEVFFPPVRPGHRMVGSGLFVVNPPFGFDEAAAEITTLFEDGYSGLM